jgi:N-carbamoyl-L-amino-acid hydrolase
MPDTRTLRIDAQRLASRLAALGQTGIQADGACCRLALSDADRAGRDLVLSWMRELGLAVQIDRIGNIFGLRKGQQDLPPVMTGSHIDTVANAGRLDGSLGVLAGLEVVETLNQAAVTTRRPIVVAAFTNEEGARFQPDMLGSLVFAGGLDVEQARAVHDSAGHTVGAELDRIGYTGALPQGALVPAAFVELHIEQGPILDAAGESLAAVDRLQGISWQEVRIHGAANHAGTTPLAMRRDAAWGAARTICFVHNMVHELGGTQVGTVGSVTLTPNLINVIPGAAVLSVDLRNSDDAQLREAENRLAAFLHHLAAETGMQTSIKLLSRFEPVSFDQRIVSLIQATAARMGQTVRTMTSGAGQDAQMLARICPTAMIFVPSIGGISHSPAEATHPDHLELGTNVLLQTLLDLAEHGVASS